VSQSAIRPEAALRGEAARIPTVISSRTKIVGEINGRGEVTVEGVVEGLISLEGQLVIERGGQVVGEVNARSVRIAGSMVGNLKATERIELLASGSVEGDLLTPRLAIHEGGLCRGRVEMRRPQEPVEGSSPTPATAARK
jgi:cytoskeletal protein CcmA (bactofilin family)